ncbi:hypothetical protein [Phascolarctobacterium succinatutens]
MKNVNKNAKGLCKSLAFFVKKIVKAGEIFFLNGRCKDAVFLQICCSIKSSSAKLIILLLLNDKR